MRRVFRRAVGAALAAALGGALLAGCGSSPTAAKPKVTVVIGYENNGADPEMVAIARGFFAQYMPGARVALRYFSSGPAALAALASGSLQFMTGIGNPPTAAAIGQGVPLKVIWAQEQYTTDEGLVVRKGSGIAQLKDLEHQNLALVVGSTSPFEVATAMAQQGIPQGSIHFVNMSPPAMVAAWERGQIDAAYVWDPAFDTMLQHGGQAIMYDRTVQSAAPIFNLALVQAPWAKAHRALVLGFIEAEQAGVEYAKAHPQQAVRQMAKEAGITTALAQTELQGYRILDAQAQVGQGGLGSGTGVASSLVTVSLASSAAYLASIQQIPAAPAQMASYVDPSYVQAVLGR